MSCGVGHRHSSDPVLQWLWRRLVATAPIRHLAWEPPYTTGAALKSKKKKKKVQATWISFNEKRNPTTQECKGLQQLSDAKMFGTLPKTMDGLFGTCCMPALCQVLEKKTLPSEHSQSSGGYRL